MAYLNKHAIRDGKILLYTRTNEGTFHARLSVEGMKGYIVKSTGKTNLTAAMQFAENLYDDIRYKLRHGEEIGIKKFKQIWNLWLKNNRSNLSSHRLRYITGTADRYLLPFFGGLEVGLINDALIQRYWDWRINFWSSNEGLEKIAQARINRKSSGEHKRSKLGNVAVVPSQKSLDMEKAVLSQILGWAQRVGMITRVPLLRPPRINKQPGISRRPAFDLEEWKKLYRFLRVWVKGGAVHGNRESRLSSLHLWQRELIRNYVLFMCSSGLRPNEARQLRWRDITPHIDSNGNENIIINVAPTTKTGSRYCVPLRNAPTIISRIQTLYPARSANDLVFSSKDGCPIENFGKTFKKILIESGLLRDHFGNERTIYSLRHTYATFRLAYGNVRIEDLAQNMGTSPSIIYLHYRHVTTIQMADVLGGELRLNESRKGLFL